MARAAAVVGRRAGEEDEKGRGRGSRPLRACGRGGVGGERDSLERQRRGREGVAWEVGPVWDE